MYKPREAKVALRPPPDMDELHILTDEELNYDGPYHDSRSDNTELEHPVIYLPHSCDAWVIGGIKEAEQLISDLQLLIQYIKDNAPQEG